MSGDRLRDEIAAALILHDHPFRNSLTRPEDPTVMLREDPTFWVCAKALSQANAVLPVVQARIAVEREQVAAQIAQAIEAERDNERVSDPEWGGLDLAAHIARQHAKGDGDG